MKPLPTALAITAVLGAVTIAFLKRDGAAPDVSGDASSSAAGAKASDRPVPVRQENRTTELPPKLTRRDPTPSQPSAEDNLRKILGEAKYTELQKARQEAQMEQQREGTLAGRTGTARVAGDRRAQAVEALREDLKTAVTTSPDNWQNTYEDLYSDYVANHHSQLAPRFSGRGTSTPAPSGPTTPPVNPGNGNAGTGGGTDSDGISYFDTPEARRQAAEARRLREYHFRNPLELRSQQDPRFRVPQ